MSDSTRPPHTHTNRLASETSPYLLQHQHNPVNWYPWGPEAFEAARSENKPIFLSVGYSTCYWCHVMERQSFEVESIAEEMNRRFINIKVDREERPDVDQLYMTAVQVLTRHGGWPMSVFLTPDLRPFYGGTYFPPTDQKGRPGFVTLLRALEDAYKNRRNDVEQSATQIVHILGQLAEPEAPPSPIQIDTDFVHLLVQRSTADYDPVNGGFGSAPKFPRETLLELLLVHNRHFPDRHRLAMITGTLDALAYGGIRDQLGGGFHRYSTDAEWLVPHFEIMLYDNAMLAWCYVEAFQQTRETRYAAVARGIFDFILREMTSPDGAFYTAFDAEVDAQEGLSYLWTRAEVQAALAESIGTHAASNKKIEKFCRMYGLDDGPNFSDPHHGTGRPEKNILYLAESENGSPLLDPDMKEMREILYAQRRQRKQPSLDTKIITSWNALMIRAFAFGGQVLQEPRYLQAASKAADFLLANHRTQDGGLHRTSRDGVAKHPGFLDDYAFLIQSFLALHEADAQARWRETAAELATGMIRKFGDPHHGGFYFSEEGATDLIVRQKVASDSPLPSGNAVAAMVLVSLDRAEAARRTIAVFAGQLSVNGEGMSALLQAAVFYLREHPPFMVSANEEIPQTDRVPSVEQTAKKIIFLTAAWASEQILNVGINISTGFHINGHEASPNMISTQLSVRSEGNSSLAVIDYPPTEFREFEFADRPLSVFTDDITIVVRFNQALPLGSTVHLALRYQACDNNSCYPPATQSLEVSVPEFQR